MYTFIFTALVFIIGGGTPFSFVWAFYSPCLLQYEITLVELWAYAFIFYFIHGIWIDLLPFEPMQQTKMLPMRIIFPVAVRNLLSCMLLLKFVSVSNRTISDAEAALYLLVAGIGNEFVYAPAHRLLHTKMLYKYHYLHHTQKAPRAIGAVYCSVVEMWFANLLSVFLPLSLTKAPLQIYFIWTICAIQTTQVHHSSKKWPFPWNGWNGKQPKYHDDHHRLVNVNFGNIGFLERLLT